MTTRILTDSNGRKYITTEPLLHPPQRTWVGLTTNEIVEALNNQSPFVTGGLAAFARAIEAKLKEKNT
jgi:hypothetical protein